MRWTVALACVLGCADTYVPPAHLEVVGSLTGIEPTGSLVFDGDNHLLCIDGGGVRRLVDLRLDRIPGTEAFAFGTIGVDRDGQPLLTSQSGIVARFQPGDVVSQLAIPLLPGGLFITMEAPDGTLYARDTTGATLALAPAAAAWEPSPLPLTHLMHADDDVLAVIDGDVVRFEADGTRTPIGSCAELGGGGSCASVVLGGFHDGRLYATALHARTLHVLEPGGAARAVELPGALVAETIAAGAQTVVLVLSDPDRHDEQSLWIVDADDRFSRITSLPVDVFPRRLLADHAGAGYLVQNSRLEVVVFP